MVNNPAMDSKEAMVAVRVMDRREVTTIKAMESKEAMVETKVMASKTTTTTRAMGSNKAMDKSLGMVSNKATAINKVMGRNQTMVIIKATPRRKVDTRVRTIISTSTCMLRAAPSTRRRRSPRTLPATRAQAGETSIRWEVTCPYDPLPTIPTNIGHLDFS